MYSTEGNAINIICSLCASFGFSNDAVFNSRITTIIVNPNLCTKTLHNLVQVLLGLLLLVYIPNLDLYPGYVPLPDSVDNKNEKPLGEHVCPERYANIFSSKSYYRSFPIANNIFYQDIMWVASRQ